MNLVLDFGNTRFKAGLFKASELVEQQSFYSIAELLQYIKGLNSVQHCLIGSVTGDHAEVLDFCSKKFETSLFKADTKTPLKNLYKSALTLGSDRIAAAVGAYSFFPAQNVLSIDAGTCIKYNFVNANNEYLGGAISPGIPMRLKAMNHFTHALPLVETDKNYEKLTGQNTQESLLSGALVGATCEVDAMVERYQAQHKNLQVVFCGGDSDYLCKQVKNRFFANQHLILYGLNTILNFNLEN